MSQIRTLQDKIRNLQQSEFIGREEQLRFFQDNLSLSPNDNRFRNIFSIFGQGGVGKTWLLKQFQRISIDSEVFAAYVDENVRDVPRTLYEVSEQFKQQGHTLKSFDERYRVYLQKKQDLESDPDAPHGLATLVGRTIAKGGLQLAKSAPVANMMMNLIPEEAIVNQAGEWADYVVKKISNKDEVRLVLQPIEVLTPLFLDGLNEVAQNKLSIFLFDTYEYTGEFLDHWLRDLLDGKYGDVPSSLILVIAGRNELDKNLWSGFGALTCLIPLESFTENVARDYLARKGITNNEVIEIILRLSGCLPLLLATLAAQSPNQPDEVKDPSNTAVE